MPLLSASAANGERDMLIFFLIIAFSTLPNVPHGELSRKLAAFDITPMRQSTPLEWDSRSNHDS
jgi:hypothetical protein